MQFPYLNSNVWEIESRCAMYSEENQFLKNQTKCNTEFRFSVFVEASTTKDNLEGWTSIVQIC